MKSDSILQRPLAEGDAPALAAFYNNLSPASIRTFRPLGYETTLDVCQKIVNENVIPPYTRFDLVCCSGTEIVGWAFLANLDKDEPELGLAVTDILQGKGIGKTLISQLLGWARGKGIKKVYLIVVTDNQRAIHVYESHGFVRYGEKFDEKDQLDYYQMVTDLSGEGWQRGEEAWSRLRG